MSDDTYYNIAALGEMLGNLVGKGMPTADIVNVPAEVLSRVEQELEVVPFGDLRAWLDDKAIGVPDGLKVTAEWFDRIWG